MRFVYSMFAILVPATCFAVSIPFYTPRPPSKYLRCGPYHATDAVVDAAKVRLADLKISVDEGVVGPLEFVAAQIDYADKHFCQSPDDYDKSQYCSEKSALLETMKVYVTSAAKTGNASTAEIEKLKSQIADFSGFCSSN